MKKVPRVLVLIDHYLPGTRTGGPVRTVAATVERLGDEFEFVVLTTDRDRGDRSLYPGVAAGAVVPVAKAGVRYLAPRRLRPLALAGLLEQLRPGVVCLNGFFARTSRNALLARRAGRLGGVPVVVAPRGDFSPGALALRRWKKNAYLRLARASGLCRGVIWQASSEHEARDVRVAIGPATEAAGSWIVVARDLTSPGGTERRAAGGAVGGAQAPDRAAKRPGAARIVFLSRIARKKNLDGAIRALGDIQGEIEFDIFGPIEDAAYWRGCERLLARLPTTVRARYRGAVPPECVHEVLAGYHLLFLPTRGENFGHVILEALLAGCPVLVSDQTPWCELAGRGVGWDLPLGAPERFLAALDELVQMDAATFADWSARARQFGASAAADPAVVEANRGILRLALASGDAREVRS